MTRAFNGALVPCNVCRTTYRVSEDWLGECMDCGYFNCESCSEYEDRCDNCNIRSILMGVKYGQKYNRYDINRVPKHLAVT